MEDYNLGDNLIDAATRVRKSLGPGRYHTAYRDRLMLALRLEGIRFEREQPYGSFESSIVYHVYRQGPAIADRILLMICRDGECSDEYQRQLFTLLRLSDLQYGIVLDFSGDSTGLVVARVVNHAWPTIGWEQRRRPATL